MEKNGYNGRLFLKFMIDFYSNFTYLALAGRMRKVRETYSHFSYSKDIKFVDTKVIIKFIVFCLIFSK